MASSAGLSPSNSKQKLAKQQLSQRIERCWNQELDWNLFPTKLREVCSYVVFATVYASIIKNLVLCMVQDKTVIPYSGKFSREKTFADR